MNIVRKYAMANKWNIGFVTSPLKDIVAGDEKLRIHWMKHNCKTSWFADPFILDMDESHIYVLVEEFFYPTKRGRISKLTVNRRDYRLEKIDVVLELPTHLSFPAILRENGKVYIYPENSASGNLTLYEYDSTLNKCTPLKVLCSQPLTDAIVTDLLGCCLIASTKMPNPNKNILGFYSGDVLVKECKFQKNTARNAGDWFALDGVIYRPAQDCSKTYGGAVIIQKVQKNGAGDFHFENVRRFESDCSDYNQGFHTFNHYKGVTVVDAKGLRFPLLNKLFFGIRKVVGRR